MDDTTMESASKPFNSSRTELTKPTSQVRSTPRAPISAVPRRFFRELSSSHDPDVLNDFKRHIRDFLAANASTIHADRVLVDFHVSALPVPLQYLYAAEEVFRDQRPDATLEEVVIFA